MNRAEIIDEINRLSSEIPRIQKVAEIAEHEGINIALDELTESCCDSVKMQDYKSSKDSIKTLEIINNFRKYLESQKERARRIECKIAELRIDLTRCQLSLFEEENKQKIDTGIKHNEKNLFTGDVYETSNQDYFLITESEEHPTNYVITGTAFDDELLLQYPKNRTVLSNTVYIGNIFEDADLATFLEKLTEKQIELQEEQKQDSEE